MTLRGRHIEKRGARLRLLAPCWIESAHVTRGLSERIGMNVEIELLREREKPKHVHRRFQHAFIIGVKAPTLDAEANFDLRHPLLSGWQETLQPFRRLLGVVSFEARAQRPRQCADLLCNEEVALHEALDSTMIGSRAVAHALGEFGLKIER